ncbi:MAG TPA: 2-methylthioadenine synthetase [Eggerthellaceae bacterium]|nr:2-methylthioadenine synthetase [Eggerthellaceae bacterium]
MSLLGASSFHIVNLGCKVNRVEADSIGASLLACGLAAAEQETADLIIVNTCTVTGEAAKKARKAVRHAIAANPVASIVVTGCAAALEAETFCAMDPRVSVRGKAEIEAELSGAAGTAPLRMGAGFRTRVGLKVQDGCDHACTYCIVHVARGPARSVPASEVLRDARAYFQAGAKELVLAGIDIGAYRDASVRLPDLARMLLAESVAANADDGPCARVRISSIEPLNVSDDLVSLLAQSDGSLCRHLHLPLQSGSSKVLAEMDRPYTAEWFAALAARLHGEVPGIALTTDVIVGFPGETERDFQQTCELVRQARFSRLHVFPYSQRAGTPAAERADQVPAPVKRERAERLRAIGRELADEDRRRRAGTREWALVEGASALTESYHELPAPPGSAAGTLVRCSF